VLLIIALSIVVAFISRSDNISANLVEEAAGQLAAVYSVASDAGLLELRPGSKAPTNGGKVRIDEKFVLELWVDGARIRTS
jgi:hypothetical protein